MNVSNDMSPLLDVKNQQVQEASKQMKANVANKIELQSSNLNLIDPEMAQQLMSQNVPMAYSANGGVKNIPTDGMVSVKA